jgi:hypothetical protein
MLKLQNIVPPNITAVLLLGLCSQMAWALGPGEVFVANYLQNSITVFARSASGAATPVRTIRTGVKNPFGVLVDESHGEIIVVNNTDGSSRVGSIVVYNANANYPNDAPKRTISGPATGLAGSTGLALDTVRDEIFVANDDTSSIAVYARTADGNVAPKRTLQGPATKLAGPLALVLDTLHDELMVVNKVVWPGGAGRVTTYRRGATGNAAPLRTIEGSLTGFDHPAGMGFDALRDEIVVSSANANALLIFRRTANGNVSPSRRIAGPSTGLCGPYGVLVDSLNSELIVANSGYGQSTCGPSTVALPWLLWFSGDLQFKRRVTLGTSDSSYPTGVSAIPLSLSLL